MLRSHSSTPSHSEVQLSVDPAERSASQACRTDGAEHDRARDQPRSHLHSEDVKGSAVKSVQVVTGEMVEVRGIGIDPEAACTSHVDVLHDGVTHQILEARDRGLVNFANTVGTFSLASYRGFIIETIDTVATQAVHRHTAVVESDTGILTAHSYDGADQLLALVGDLGIVATRDGMTINPTGIAEVASTVRAALPTVHGLLEISPLNDNTIDQLPTWSGTDVDHGQLYSGSLNDDSAYLVHVSETARSVLMVAPSTTRDDAALFMSGLRTTWQI